MALGKYPLGTVPLAAKKPSPPPPATTAIPPKLQGLNSQFATIIAHRLGGVLEQ